MALTTTPPAELGWPCPSFSLPATDGKTYTLEDFKTADALVIMFICNHCPYVKAIEERLIAFGKTCQEKNVAVFAISANDAENYPEDSFAMMQKKTYPFPYAYDEDQSVAKAFGAVCTPDFFLFDKNRQLVYRGRLDDSWKDASKVERQELLEAVECTLKGERPQTEQNPSMGCNIKWKN